MPTTLAQWTGIAVTSIVVLGTDMDVVYAVPLGLFAGALATFFSTIALGYAESPQPAKVRSRAAPRSPRP